jgi:putative colanic acid biosynthesis UDP-glucose lipid carrier transferase
MLRPHQPKLRFLFRIGDGVLLVASLWALLRLNSIPWNQRYSLIVASAVGSFYFLAETVHLYGSWRGAPLGQIVRRVLFTWTGTLVGVVTLIYLTRASGQVHRLSLALWSLTVPAMLVAWRWTVQKGLGVVRARGFNSRIAAIVGAEEHGYEIARTIRATPSLGLELLGLFDDRATDRRNGGSDPAEPVRGNLDELIRFARAGEVDRLYIALPLRAEKRIKELAENLADTTTKIYIVPNFFVFDLLHARWVNLGNVPTVSITETPLLGVNGWLKRAEDIVLATVFLVLGAAPMLLIAAAIKLTSKGTVLFRQRRFGMDGKEFQIFKFRTMTVCEDGDEIPQATRDDPRVTRLGGALRRHFLDELPQLINVLQGRMSIVGPRPHATSHNERYRTMIRRYMMRHLVKPGMTGWAQVNGLRGETETLDKMKARVEHDLYYIRNWSVGFDLRIIARTVTQLFRSDETR